MKITTKETLAYQHCVLTFSKSEMAAIRRAGEIAEKARDAIQAELGHDDHPLDVILAQLAYNVTEFEDGEITIHSELKQFTI